MSATRYLEIAERLSAELAECAHGTRVAGEAEIARRFGVGRAAARAAVQELERRFVVRRTQGAGTFVNRRIDYVISPERQRVNLAAGTVQPPRLLLLDEPVSALDPADREAALELVDSLTGQGVAVLAVFHEMDAIRRLASRVVFVGEGRIARQGAPDQMLEAAA
ncbi:GntR family transcriptional regulator [Streptomyces rugosispiralis]|uniref:GntR family transcriptional regulator n=1 Tax=Streptomyces rugosispiralis TaxID=2967341 RepID=A0ABT1UQL6_9ACTN|nr:GntR family transcriptional regulator [Streptomyces rugosispiralis]MCQ8187078.1 GntR family transcriptional regulator [Streptomyces rugosispiralis]